MIAPVLTLRCSYLSFPESESCGPFPAKNEYTKQNFNQSALASALFSHLFLLLLTELISEVSYSGSFWTAVSVVMRLARL